MALTPIHHTMNEATISLPRARKEIKLTAADEARFWSKVNKDGPTMPHMESPCWVWTAGVFRHGYGAFDLGGKKIGSHRASWTIANGVIQDNLCVCHRCDNPACCRHDHLFLGTHADNAKDKTMKGRQAKGSTHSSRTHPERVMRGEAHKRSKLTDTQVLAIRAIYAAGGITQTEIGLRYGVTQALIGYIIRRANWKHLP